MPVGTGSTVEGWGVGGDDDRITVIRRQVFQAVNTHEAAPVIWTARAILAACPSRDEKCELQALWNAIKAGPLPVRLSSGEIKEVPGIRFVEDPRWTDTYPSAAKILQWAAEGSNGEDCDGHVILMCSLLLVSGWLPGVCIATKDGIEFTHIFPVAGFPKDDPQIWVPLDTTVDAPGVGPGWWPPKGWVHHYRVYGLTLNSQVMGRDFVV